MSYNTPVQSPTARTDADVARIVQENVQRQVQRDMEQARREIDQAIREAREAAEGAGRNTTVSVVPPPFPGAPQVPEGVVTMSVAFFVMCAVIAIGLPIARAFSRRMDRRNATAPVADTETRARLERIEQAVDAIAVEVERISEGQRFTTKIIGDLRALPQPDPSVAVPDRVAVPISRAREAR
jgi:hypothetical protein